MTWLLSRVRARRVQLAEERAASAPFRWLAQQPRPTRADLRFSLLVGILLAASPMTGSARMLPSIVLGTIGAAVVLVARLRRPRVADAALERFTFARPSPLVVAMLALGALAFAPTLMWLYAKYTDAIWQKGHGLFVPLFMILLARHALRCDASAEEESCVRGFAFLLPGLALAVLDAGVGSHYLSAIGLVLVLPGVSLLLLGARRTRVIAVPLALGIFLVPLPTSLERFAWLSEGSAAIARSLLSPFDLPVIWNQTQAVIWKEQVRLPIWISQNCSGASTLYAGIAFATMVAFTARSRARRWLPLLIVYPAVVFVNGLRCVAVILLTWYLGGSVWNTPIHGLSGIAVFLAVLVLIWLCADREGLREALS